MPVATCPARAALAGNPSDLYGGAVVAVPVRTVAATVSVEPADRFEICHSPTADDSFSTLDELVTTVDRFGFDGVRPLVVATIRALVRAGATGLAPVRVDVSTTIPRSVGLAGSSAVVIATIRALADLHPGDPWVDDLVADPTRLAMLARSVEADELDHPAGLQDRLVQTHDAALLMEFADEPPACTALPDPPGELFVASLPDTASPSDVTHRSLRSTWNDDIGVRAAMDEIAEQGSHAGRAIRCGDVASLGAAMDATLAVRRRLMLLDPHHLAMAETAQNLGCHANWSGSGGSITVLAPNAMLADSARRALADELGAAIVELV